MPKVRAIRDQLSLDAAVEQVVGRLLGNETIEAEFLRAPKGFDNLPGGEGRTAEVAHFAGTDEVVEGAQRLIDGDFGLGAVDLIQVDMIRLEPAQAGFASLHEMTAGVAPGVGVGVVHPVVDFRAKDDPVAPAVALQRLAHELLAFSP